MFKFVQQIRITNNVQKPIKKKHKYFVIKNSISEQQFPREYMETRTSPINRSTIKVRCDLSIVQTHPFRSCLSSSPVPPQSSAPLWRRTPPAGTVRACPSPDTCPSRPALSYRSPSASGRKSAPGNGGRTDRRTVRTQQNTG